MQLIVMFWRDTNDRFIWVLSTIYSYSSHDWSWEIKRGRIKVIPGDIALMLIPFIFAGIALLFGFIMGIGFAYGKGIFYYFKKRGEKINESH